MIYDVCIVGSGAGAGPVAYELSKAGYKVLVLEKGPWYKREDMFKDEIAVGRRSSFIPRLDEEQHVLEELEEGKWKGTPTLESGWNFWNGNIVGGSSNLMSGYFHRLKPKDFKLKSSYEEIENSNVVDWPISYEDLEPYYTKVESIVGVSGYAKKHPFLEPRSTPDFPYSATHEHVISSWLDKACERLSFIALPTPRAILSRDEEDRRGCEYAGYCGSYGCASGAKSSAREALINKAIKTGNCTVLADSFVKRLKSNAKEVTEIEYIDKENKSHFVQAKIYVLAAQAIESSRLLLNSKNKFFKNGLANNSNQVGKNLVFSAGGIGEGAFYYEDFSQEEAKELSIIGPFVNRSLQDWYELDEGKKKGATIDFLFEHNNAVARATQAMSRGDLVWGDALRKKVLHDFKKRRIFTFEIFADWTPHNNCFVSLDEEIKDKWGMPVAKVRIGAHPYDIEVGNEIAKYAEKVLEEMGAREISSSISPYPPQNLQAGGCRFGDNAKASVLDKNCKAHELNNLYVSDGSFMPTGGSVPFTWTIYANSFRVADAIIKDLQG